MAADLNLVLPKLSDKVQELLELCHKKGCIMRPSTGLRDPYEQGRLWRQSRSIEEINKTISKFRSAGANFLADCIESVGPRNGKHATDAPPGLSWHQWGESVDCFWLVGDSAEWSIKKKINGVNGYQVYTEQASNVGLFPGGAWVSFKDWPHVQLRHKNEGVLDLMKLQNVDEIMKERFG